MAKLVNFGMLSVKSRHRQKTLSQHKQTKIAGAKMKKEKMF
jgi:hypothetical protein